MEERIKALEGILPYLSDDVVRGIQLTLEVLLGVHNWQPEKSTEKAESKQTSIPAKRKYNYKAKQCKKCGKEFKPNYGAQTICKDCAAKNSDIKSTAKDLFESE